MCHVLERRSTRLSSCSSQVHICVTKHSVMLSLIISVRLQKLLGVQICLNMFGSKCRIVQARLQRVEDITILNHSHWAVDGTRFAAPLFFFEKVFK